MKSYTSRLVRKFAILSVLCASLVSVSGLQAWDYTCCESDCEWQCYAQYEECMYYCDENDWWCQYECQVNGTDCDQGCSMECDPSC